MYAVMSNSPLPGLYIVATPIGNLGDLSDRARVILSAADVVACEDTRVTGKLLHLSGIKRPLLRHDDHADDRARASLVERMASEVVVLVSDAGTPLISDPGYRLVRDARAAGRLVTSIPGACAAVTALTMAGLPTDRFLFAGFPPPKSAARRTFLGDVTNVHATLIFYESGPRLRASLTDMAAVFGDREAAVARELTKLFETTVRGTLSALASDPRLDAPKGEIVILVGPGVEQASTAEDADTALADALTRLPPGEAASEVARALGLNRRDLYKRAMALKDGR